VPDDPPMPPIGSRASIGRLGACLPSIALVAVLLPGQASAARIDAKERAAKKACMTGDPAKGVALLADLFIDTNDPTYIYNQGRCYEQNNRYEDAIGRFREYLRKATRATAEEKADTEKHIADCQALQGKKEEPARSAVPAPEAQRPAAAPSPEPPRPAPAPAAAPSLEPPAAKLEPDASVAAVPSPSQAPSPPGSGLRVAGITTLAIGAAALAGGLAMNLKYNGMIDDLQGEYDPGTDDSSKTYKTLAIVGYAAGAACLAGGAILYYLGWRAGRVSVAPVPVAGGAAAVLEGAF
jgi:hypothetical protein